MLTVKLEGQLGVMFGTDLRIEAHTVADVLQILSANFPRFRQFIKQSLEQGIRYTIRVGHTLCEPEQSCSPFSGKVRRITITPIVQGAGGGFGRVLFGAALLGLGLAGVGFLGVTAKTLALTGGVILGTSLLGMIFGREKSPQDSERDGRRSLLFDRPPQTILDGNRYPVAYGWPLVGLYLLSVRQRTWLTA